MTGTIDDDIAAMDAARIGPHVTCPFSRHVAMMAKALAKDGEYKMLSEDPIQCAESLAVVVAALWKARAMIAKGGG